MGMNGGIQEYLVPPPKEKFILTMASSDHSRQNCFFQDWVRLQKQDLLELLQTLNQTPESSDREEKHSELVQKGIKCFEDYINQRNQLAQDDVSAFFAPTWCTSLENSLLWIAGCRPSCFIRLVYVLCGMEFESKLTEFLEGVRTGELSELSAKQLGLIDSLQMKTINEEEKISSRMASLQEDIADNPIAVIAKASSSQTGELTGVAEHALDEHARGMSRLLEDADGLRFTTFKELISILTPVQGVEFLVASKKLHLSMHAWGVKIDLKHGRECDN